MQRVSSRFGIVAATIGLVLTSGSPPAQAIHFYRNSSGGCAPADGWITDDPENTVANITATVVVGHNTYSEGVSGFAVGRPPETRIKVGETVAWTWNSAHCHSVTSSQRSPAGLEPLWESGFLYPEQAPESPRALQGAFDYPVLDETPTLTYGRTFFEPGAYAYFCVHHESIGMRGIVIVEPE